MDESRDHTKPPAADTKNKTEPSPDTQDNIITPLRIGVQEKPARFKIKRKDFLKPALLIFSLVVIIVGGLWLFNYLSKNPVRTVPVSIKKVTPEPQPKEVATTLPALLSDKDEDRERIAEEKKEAEQKLADFLHTQKRLDAKGVAEWGGELYERVVQLSKEADASFINREFVTASRHYAEATTLLNQLYDSADDVFQRLLNDGQTALEQEEDTRAQQLFSAALMIDPASGIAQRNLEKAKNSGTVRRLIASGANNEKNNNLALARADYQEAVKLDPGSARAQEGLTRVSSQIAIEQFQKLMSSGLAALNSGEYTRARSLLLEARSYRPDSPEVKDALLEVDAAIRLARIRKLQDNALAAEKSEDWKQALALYQAVLEVDNSIQFALQGKEYAIMRDRLETRINEYLEKPKRLESDRFLKEAIELIKEAKQIEQKGPRCTQQLKKLDELVRLAQIPVSVTIESDSMTEVVVYKVGKLGSFHTKDLKLRPGTYTIVGARNGFKDVRKKISVNAEKDPLRITVQCREKI